jgi:hypothetical protein
MKVKSKEWNKTQDDFLYRLSKLYGAPDGFKYCRKTMVFLQKQTW